MRKPSVTGLRKVAVLLTGVLVATAACTAVAAAPPIKVGFIEGLSGPNAALGLPQQRGLQVALAQWPEVDGHKVEVITEDDGSDPAASERLARKLVHDDHVDILIGTTGVPNVMAVASVAASTQTPLIAPDPPAHPTVDPAHQWMVTAQPPFIAIVGTVVRQMKKDGVKTVAYIGFSDALGDLVYSDLVATTRQVGIKVLDDQRYARTDTSVTGQAAKMMSLDPDAVFAGVSGSAGALPFLTLRKLGYKGRFYSQEGIFNDAFVKVVGDAGNGLITDTGAGVVADQLPAGNPIRPLALDFLKRYRGMFHAEPTGLFESFGYDSYRIFRAAAERAKGAPGTAAYRTSLKDALLSTHGLVLINGIASFKPGTYYGYAASDSKDLVPVRLENGKWKLVK